MKQLKRSRSDRVLFGVCGGLGEYLGVDSDVVRVVWVFLGLTGVGLIPYVAGIFLMPESDTGEAARSDRMPRNLGLLLIGIAGFALLQQLGLGGFGLGLLALWSWKFLLPLLCLVAGVLLVWPRTRDLVGFTSQRKLRRSVSNRVLAGICGGIADEVGVDANVVRLGLILLTFLTSGIAAIAYLLLFFVIPEEELPEPTPVTAPPTGVADPPPPPADTPSPGGSPADPAAAGEGSADRPVADPPAADQGPEPDQEPEPDPEPDQEPGNAPAGESPGGPEDEPVPDQEAEKSDR